MYSHCGVGSTFWSSPWNLVTIALNLCTSFFAFIPAHKKNTFMCDRCSPCNRVLISSRTRIGFTIFAAGIVQNVSELTAPKLGKFFQTAMSSWLASKSDKKTIKSKVAYCHLWIHDSFSYPSHKAHYIEWDFSYITEYLFPCSNSEFYKKRQVIWRVDRENQGEESRFWITVGWYWYFVWNWKISTLESLANEMYSPSLSLP